MATLLAIMVRNSKNPGAKKPEAHKVILPPTNVKLVKFPDYILCGSLNLHKSPVNAAALAKYINKQWDFLRINENGVISSQQLEINRNPSEHGGLRDGKPLTVTEWKKMQKAKLLETRKQLAEAESQGDHAGSSTTKGPGSSKDKSVNLHTTTHHH